MDKKPSTLEEDIQAKITDLEIEAKRTRNKEALYIFLMTAVTVLLSVYGVYFRNGLLAVFAFIIGSLEALYLLVIGVHTLLQPLSREDYAFKKIAEAINLLRKSKMSKLALEEASNCVRAAYIELANVSLDDLEWYDDVNTKFKKFVKNLRLLIPEIANGKVNMEDLEKIAVAVSSRNSSKLEEAFSQLTLTEGKTVELSLYKRMENFFGTHRILSNTIFVIVLVSSCIIFYSAVTVYVGIAKDYAFAGSIALFVGILTLYFNLTRRK
jgi:hypothetical protein